MAKEANCPHGCEDLPHGLLGILPRIEAGHLGQVDLSFRAREQGLEGMVDVRLCLH
jgi:hypothetical protein